MSIKIVFMGSPDFAVPVLQAIAQHYQVVGVVTQPDRPSGRGMQLTPPPVKVAAQELGLEVIQPEKLREPWVIEKLQSWAPDLIVVAAFGQILRANVLELPRYGCLNVHASLLPRHRGAAPIQAAILAGDHETGITIMKMDAGLDTGAILSQRSIPISASETGGSLAAKLAQIGAPLLLETLPGYLAGQIQPQIQAQEQVTYAGMIKKEAGALDFSRPAPELERKIRAYQPWPGTFLVWKGAPLKILQAHVAAGSAQPGEHLRLEGLPAIGTAGEVLVLDMLQPAGKKPMPGRAFLAGARDWTGT